ncbi:hypothetical protein M0802_000241 [Mischocyttarus mexicanus]|nr:hypothetical protein M0802_000241 [Mischocyttarus mexicanus]
MDHIQEVRQLELLCKQLYESQDAAHRAEAEKALVAFQNAPDTLTKCQLLLDRGDSVYAQLLAATTLTKLISRSAQGLSLQQRLDIRNYVLNYLATQPKLPNFVIQALVALFARISKLGWFDSEKEEYVFRNVVGDITKFLQGSVEHCMIGVQLLSQLTCEMNQISEVDASRSLAKHRRIASSFRDTQLFEIFRLSCTLLSTARENCKSLNFNNEAQHGLMRQLLKLAQNCLTFDFIGTSTDESTDDLSTVQIPTNWRPAFLDFTSLKLFFDLYHNLPSSLSSLALSCLVQIASVRRSLFSNTERAKFLSHLVDGVKHILQNPQGLSDPGNYHEFCRLLSRLKSNFQLGELVLVEDYPEAIQLIAKFTVQSLRMWQFAPNSLHYLLTLWQRMVSSMPYVKAGDPHLLNTYTPEIANVYITSRLESVAVVVRERLEDPLDDLGVLHQQLEQISVIGRCEYQKTCTLLVQLFDQAATTYQELMAQTASSTQQIDISIQEGQLTWLVYIIGGVIGGRVTFNSNEEYDAMDGELVCRVLQLMNLTDSRLGQGGCEKLDCVRKLVKLEEVQFMLNNHTREHFPFLGNNVAVTEMRCRSMFYTSLGRLLMVDLGEDEERFHTFMLPLTAALESLGQLMGAADTPLFAAEEAKKSIDWCSKRSQGHSICIHNQNFRYPNYTPILLHAVELWHHEPQVTTPVLKLFAELVLNRSQRLQFDASSPNGILLFREASKVICSYGNHILNIEVPKDQIYPLKLKGISICFSMLKAALCGSYVNFGVFRLYGDEALDNALNTFVKLLLSIPQSDLLDYPKLSATYYVLLEYLAQDHMVFLSTLEPRVFLYILSSISEGLTALGAQKDSYTDTMVCTGCCATLDHIVTYLFKQLYQKAVGYPGRKNAVVPGGGELFLEVLKQHPEILQQILSTVLNVIMFEDCRNQWSMSRPLLGLILLNEEYFNQLRENIIRSQPVDKQGAMAQWFENLMDGIERNLLTKNRDRFTQNLSMFRRDINDALKGPNISTNSVNEMMT